MIHLIAMSRRAGLPVTLDAYDAEGHAALAAMLDTPVASGEMLTSVAEHAELIRLRSVDFIQPDAPRVGGITPMLRVMALADQARLRLAPQVRRAGAGLDDHPTGRQVAAQHGERTLGVDGLVQRPDHVVVEHLRAGDVVAQRAAVHRERIALQVRPAARAARRAGRRRAR